MLMSDHKAALDTAQMLNYQNLYKLVSSAVEMQDLGFRVTPVQF